MSVTHQASLFYGAVVSEISDDVLAERFDEDGELLLDVDGVELLIVWASDDETMVVKADRAEYKTKSLKALGDVVVSQGKWSFAIKAAVAFNKISIVGEPGWMLEQDEL